MKLSELRQIIKEELISEAKKSKEGLPFALAANIEKYGKPQRRNYEGGVDVVINFTGGGTWGPTLRCVKRGGKILVCGATAGYDPKEDLRYVWSFELQIIGSNSFYDENLKALMDMISAKLEGGEVVLEHELRVVEEPPDERALAVVDAAGGTDAEQALH